MNDYIIFPTNKKDQHLSNYVSPRHKTQVVNHSVIPQFAGGGGGGVHFTKIIAWSGGAFSLCLGGLEADRQGDDFAWGWPIW